MFYICHCYLFITEPTCTCSICWHFIFAILLTLAQLTVIGLLIYGSYVYLYHFDEEHDHVLEFVIYQAFTVQLLVPILVMFYQKCYWWWNLIWCSKNKFKRVLEGFTYLFCLPIRFDDPSQYVRVNWRLNWEALIFFVAPVINVALIGVLFHKIKEIINNNPPPVQNHDDCLNSLIIYLAAEIPGLMYYGWFTCQVYLARKQFLLDFTKAARECCPQQERSTSERQHRGEERNQTRDNERRNRISQMKIMVTKQWLDMKGYRQFIWWWLCFAVSFVVLGITAQFQGFCTVNMLKLMKIITLWCS